MKVNREKLKELIIIEKIEDGDVAKKLNCSPHTVQNIRLKELHIKYPKKRIENGKEWRKLHWNRVDGKYLTGSSIAVPCVYYLGLNIIPGAKILYRITQEKPNRLILEFRK